VFNPNSFIDLFLIIATYSCGTHLPCIQPCVACKYFSQPILPQLTYCTFDIENLLAEECWQNYLHYQPYFLPACSAMNLFTNHTLFVLNLTYCLNFCLGCLRHLISSLVLVYYFSNFQYSLIHRLAHL